MPKKITSKTPPVKSKNRRSKSREPKKLSAVQKVKKAKRNRNIFQTVAAVVLFISLIGFGYYLGSNANTSLEKNKAVQARKNNSDIFKGVAVTANTKVYSDKAGFDAPDIIGKLMKKQDERRKKRLEEEKRKEALKETDAKTTLQKGGKPRLVIIIDDVSQPWQIRSIKALGFSVTPSIFPPSQQSKNSNKLAIGLKHFMVHLPMQSDNAKMNTMQGTLRVTDSSRQMKARAKEIRKLFPQARFINNHTGSVFTSNYKAMKRMYGYLRAEGFVFLDSRTGGGSKVKRIAKEYGDRYIVRDVFIDNTQSVAYIHNQLAKAVKIAKRRGYAVAIGHPHKITFKALASAGRILNGVDLVFIDELYR